MRSDAPQQHSDAAKKKILSVAFVTMFLDLLGFGLIIPIQPFYAESFGATPAVVTLLGGAYSAMQFIFIPVWGRISDRIGRRPVILISVIASSIGHLFFGLAGSLTALFAARLLTGIGNANIATVQALIADSTEGHERTKGMGLVGAAFGLGFIVGPALGGFFVRWGLAAPAYVASAMALVNFAMAFFMLPETNKYRQGKGEPARPRLPMRQVFKLANRLENVWVITFLMLCWTLGFSVFQQALALFIEKVWIHIPPDAMAKAQAEGAAAVEALRHSYYEQAAGLTAIMMVATGMTAAIVQGGLIGKLAKRFGERTLLRIGMPLIALGIGGVIVVGQMEYFPAMLGCAVIMAMGTGLTSPSLMSLLSQSSPPNVQGSVLGVGQSASSLGRVIGPAISGLLFEIHLNLPAFTGVLVIVVGIVASIFVKRPGAEPDEIDLEELIAS